MQKSSKVSTIIKGLSYNIPTFITHDKGHQVLEGNIALKFCNKRAGLSQAGVVPNHLLTAVAQYIEDEEYPHTEDIVELLNGVINLIKVGQKNKAKNG